MSVINQMLQDLDQRRADRSGHGDVDVDHQDAWRAQTRPSSASAQERPVKRFGMLGWLAASVLLSGVSAYAVWQWQSRSAVASVKIAAPEVEPRPAVSTPSMGVNPQPSESIASLETVAEPSQHALKEARFASAQPQEPVRHKKAQKAGAHSLPDKESRVEASSQAAETAPLAGAKADTPKMPLKQVSTQQQARYLTDQAQLLQRQGRMAEAEARLRQALQVQEHEPRALLLLARQWVGQRRLSEALNLLASTPSPTADILGLQGVLLIQSGQYAQAAPLLERALAKDGRPAVWWASLASARLAQGQVSIAREALSQAWQAQGQDDHLQTYMRELERSLVQKAANPVVPPIQTKE